MQFFRALCETFNLFINFYLNFEKYNFFSGAQGYNLKVSFDENRSVPVNYTIYQYRVIKTERPRTITNTYKDIGEWNPDKKLVPVKYRIFATPRIFNFNYIKFPNGQQLMKQTFFAKNHRFSKP